MYTTLSHENMHIIHTANFNRIFLEWHTIIQVEDEKVQFEGSNQNFDDKTKVSIGKDCLSHETNSQPLTIVNGVQCSNLEIWTLKKGKGNIKIQPTSPHLELEAWHQRVWSAWSLWHCLPILHHQILERTMHLQAFHGIQQLVTSNWIQ